MEVDTWALVRGLLCSCPLQSGFSLGLLSDPKYGGEMFLRNVFLTFPGLHTVTCILENKTLHIHRWEDFRSNISIKLFINPSTVRQYR
jgi:hypothetical protein